MNREQGRDIFQVSGKLLMNEPVDRVCTESSSNNFSNQDNLFQEELMIEIIRPLRIIV